ncbi:MAG: type II toxin-antitoxin system PemK/MazF family toxin [Planctomycetota bacterium]
MPNPVFARGAVHWYEPPQLADGYKGLEQVGRHLCVVVSLPGRVPDKCAVIVPMSSKTKFLKYPGTTLLPQDDFDGDPPPESTNVAHVFHVRMVDAARIGGHVASLNSQGMRRIEICLRQVLGMPALSM